MNLHDHCGAAWRLVLRLPQCRSGAKSIQRFDRKKLQRGTGQRLHVIRQSGGARCGIELNACGDLRRSGRERRNSWPRRQTQSESETAESGIEVGWELHEQPPDGTAPGQDRKGAREGNLDR
jgi:hypothetical protein